MKESLANFLKPVNPKTVELPGFSSSDMFKNVVEFFDGSDHFFSEKKYDVILIGVPGDTVTAIRKWLYSLRKDFNTLSIADAGNLLGKSDNDRYYALQYVAERLISKETVVLFIGGCESLNRAVLDFAKKVNSSLSLAVVDSIVDNWLAKSIDNCGNYIEDVVLAGAQRYFLAPGYEKLFIDNFYRIIYLGDLRAEIDGAEPGIRDADSFFFSFKSVKGEPHKVVGISSPHGIEPYDACKMMRFAGFSDKVKIAALSDIDCKNGYSDKRTLLAAQMVWFFIDGVAGRCCDHPTNNDKRYVKKYITPHGMDEGITFYDNSVTGRWWIEVPAKNGSNIKSCREVDYNNALEGDIPDTWWRFFRKNRSG
ncbi:hypothetical protein QA597_11035 [Marinilabiliaceae bacterium ANBcel2]|nr:hypothetical protein [Marinilabiliaceae bacterium ANBcel2]